VADEIGKKGMLPVPLLAYADAVIERVPLGSIADGGGKCLERLCGNATGNGSSEKRPQSDGA
jgi:hypothetical protein